jgi:phospholipase/carboxylesterase
MPTKTNSNTYLNNGWVFKAVKPTSPTRSEIIILLHGWTGDENSMDIFVRAFPTGTWLISPRAPVSAKEKGYSWLSTPLDIPDAWKEFEQTAPQIWTQILGWKRILDIPLNTPVSLVGFSQGGTMALLLSFLYADQIRKAACLSGFLPNWGKEIIKPHSLTDKPYLITHGVTDHLIPVERARIAKAVLENAGATVTYCEGSVGHKLSADCFSALKKYFS